MKIIALIILIIIFIICKVIEKFKERIWITTNTQFFYPDEELCDLEGTAFKVIKIDRKNSRVKVKKLKQ